MVDTSRVDGAIQRSQDHLLGLQDPAGFWVGELEADTTITSRVPPPPPSPGYRRTPDLERKALRYLRERQGADGSWNLYEAGAGDLSATIKAYFAMKMAGRPRRGPGPDPGARVDPGARRPDPGQRLHEDHAGPVRPVPVGRRARRCRSRSCCCPGGRTSTSGRSRTGRGRSSSRFSSSWTGGRCTPCRATGASTSCGRITSTSTTPPTPAAPSCRGRTSSSASTASSRRGRRSDPVPGGPARSARRTTGSCPGWPCRAVWAASTPRWRTGSWRCDSWATRTTTR